MELYGVVVCYVGISFETVFTIVVTWDWCFQKYHAKFDFWPFKNTSFNCCVNNPLDLTHILYILLAP
jgi:hypothetical protein